MGGTSRALLGLFALVACDGGASRERERPIPAQAQGVLAATRDADTSKPAREAKRPLARAATRCAECHADIAEQWEDSAHAQAATGPLYTAMVEDLGADAARDQCQRCHEPLAAIGHEEARVAAEGVTCDVCHSIAKVDVGQGSASFEMALADNVKFGPYCDAPDHYFHRMGCSPLHQESRLCAGCHTHDAHVGEQPLGVFTEYQEWAQGPLADTHQCQDCHMPRVDGEVAVGWEPREGVNHHGLLGAQGELRAAALTVSASARPGAQHTLDVEIDLRNDGAGHYVPTGLPGRRLVVSARALDVDGEAQGEASVSLGRELLDAQGEVAPFYRAVRVGKDTRIAPEQTHSLHLRVPRIDEGVVEIRVVLERLDPTIAARVSAPASQGAVLASGTLEIKAAMSRTPLHATAPTPSVQ